MILPIKYEEIIKCKKCGKIIEDTENAKLDKVGYNPYIIGEFPIEPYVLWEMRERIKQEKYNKKYKTKNIYYRFGICKDCLEKRNIIKRVTKAILDVIIVR